MADRRWGREEISRRHDSTGGESEREGERGREGERERGRERESSE